MPIPQLSVMGDQSSGKSSVLEFLSGVPFPRGTGLVTRCATQYVGRSLSFFFLSLSPRCISVSVSIWRSHFLILLTPFVVFTVIISLLADQPPYDRLSMKRVLGQSFRGSAKVRWGEAHQPDASGPIRSKAEVADKIEQLTAALVGDGEFSDGGTIVVELEAADLPDLTIIDLPGLVRTTTAGQTKSIIAQVDGLVQRYLESERTIVLCVVPANVDIATSDILERAHKVRAASVFVGYGVSGWPIVSDSFSFVGARTNEDKHVTS